MYRNIAVSLRRTIVPNSRLEMCKSFEGAVNFQVAKVESPGTVLPFAEQVWYLALLDEDAQLAWAVVEIDGCLTKLH